MPPRQRILVVDDTPANIAIIGLAISDLYEIIVATSGSDALRLAGVAPLPDLILLDILMPGMDGYEVCQKLKESPITRNIPVIFITALSEVNEEEKGFLLGAVDYITKPISPPIVRARVATHLALHDQTRELELLVDQRTRELEINQDMTIRSLAILAEYRDNETGGHIIRTQHYVRILTNELKTSPKFAPLFADSRYEELLFKSTPLHDVGKVAIPDHILLKPSRLSEEEFAEIKKHSSYGGDALRKAEESLATGTTSTFLEVAKKMAYSHHEKYDGSGYPEGLSGDDIPVEGRLMAIADIYDALVSKRTYKPPFSHAKACRIILQGDGRVEPGHFDPEVLAAFARRQDAFKEVARQFADSEEERQVLDGDESPAE
jgi:putative two-component system response regulator